MTSKVILLERELQSKCYYCALQMHLKAEWSMRSNSGWSISNWDYLQARIYVSWTPEPVACPHVAVIRSTGDISSWQITFAYLRGNITEASITNLTPWDLSVLMYQVPEVWVTACRESLPCQWETVHFEVLWLSSPPVVALTLRFCLWHTIFLQVATKSYDILRAIFQAKLLAERELSSGVKAGL